MKLLDGSELAGYIKERQAKTVRSLRQSWRVIPKLAIIQTGDNPVSSTYVGLKCEYGNDIGIETEVFKTDASKLIDLIEEINHNDNIHGIIIQLPLTDPSLTDAAINAVDLEKDVDGLGNGSSFIPATVMAIDWLLAGYNVDLDNKKIAIVGKGRLVGAPLAKLWRDAGYEVLVCDSKTPDLTIALQPMEVIVSATGKPGLITSDMIRIGATVVDAGTASEGGKLVGDLAEDVRSRDDLTVTPIKGGVGPLTIAALFDNIITAARKVADKKGQQDLG